MLAKTPDYHSLEPEPPPLDVYWTPPGLANLDDVHPTLQQAIVGRIEITLHSSCVFECASATPIGNIDIAVDNQTNLVCCVYSEFHNSEEVSTNIVWYPVRPTLDDCVEVFIDAIQSRGWL